MAKVLDPTYWKIIGLRRWPKLPEPVLLLICGKFFHLLAYFLMKFFDLWVGDTKSVWTFIPHSSGGIKESGQLLKMKSSS